MIFLYSDSRIHKYLDSIIMHTEKDASPFQQAVTPYLINVLHSALFRDMTLVAFLYNDHRTKLSVLTTDEQNGGCICDIYWLNCCPEILILQ